jgi:hypothetical protein
MDVQFLTADEERELAYQALAGDDAARNRIVMGMYPLIFNTCQTGQAIDRPAVCYQEDAASRRAASRANHHALSISFSRSGCFKIWPSR